MLDQATHCFESMRAKKHDRQVSGNAIEGLKAWRQPAHIHTFESQPRKLLPLNRPRARYLSRTGIDAQHPTGRPHLLGQVERRDAMSRGYIEHGCTGK